MTNTKYKKILTKTIKIGEKEIVYSIENLFASGEYSVSPAIADKNAKIFFDWKNEMKKFKVINMEYNSGGVADLNHNIIIK